MTSWSASATYPANSTSSCHARIAAASVSHGDLQVVVQVEDLHPLADCARVPRHHGGAVEHGDSGGGQLDP